MRILPALSLCVAGLITGCGGGGTSLPSNSSASIAFAVQWPEQSRFIHQSADRIRISAKVNGLSIALPDAVPDSDTDPQTVTLNKPSTTVNLPSLPSGPITFTVESFRSNTPATILGKAVVSKVLLPGNNPNLEFVLESQTTSVVVTADPVRQHYVAGDIVQFSAQAMQGDAVVLSAPGDFEFLSADPSVIAVDAAGRGEVLRSGVVEVFARERGNDTTGRDSRYSVTVREGFTNVVIGTGQIEPLGIEDDGTVFGNIVPGAARKGWIWSSGAPTIINPPSGFESFELVAKSGTLVVGLAEDFDTSLNNSGYKYVGGVWTRIFPPGGYAFSIPYSCNSRGEILVRNDGVPAGSGLQPYTEVIGAAGGRTSTSPVVGRHLSESGVVSGVLVEGQSRRPAFWKDGQTIPVAYPPESSDAEVISSLAGSFAHVLSRTGGETSWLLLDGQYTVHHVFRHRGVNPSGTIIADDETGPEREAMIYRNGQWSRLDDFLPLASQWNIVGARAINGPGAVVATAVEKGQLDLPQNRVILLLSPTN